MSNIVTAKPDATGQPAVESTQPLTVPKKGFFRLIGEVLDHAGPGYLQFAITNICNARCGFCSFAADQFDPTQRRSVTLQQAKDVIDICVKNHIGYMLFVGGEPLAHKDLRAMVRYAAERGVRPMICTNGSLWTEQNMRALAADGLASVIMSIDSHDAARHEKNRGLQNNCQRIKQANTLFNELGIPTTASITISRLIDDYNLLPPFLKELGFKSCTFSYPLTTLSSGYLSYRESSLIQFTPEELMEQFDKIKAMKKSSPFPVVNPAASMEDMKRHLKGEKEVFGCLGGYKYFYLDWNLNLYRCHYWEKPMCSIYDFDASKLIRDGCTRCMIDCYRDPSVLQHIAVSVCDTWKHLKQGELRQAAKCALDRRNIASLRAIWEERKFIGSV